MNYFQYFPTVDYFFGDERIPDRFQNIAIYADILDDVKQNSSFYQDYIIQEFQRPDQVSQDLYGTPNYHWTLYMMNDKLRERGWPLTNRELIAKAQKDYPNTVITTRTTLYDRFQVGQTITGLSSAATAKIDHRHLDMGQISLINVSGTFQVGETISSTNTDGELETINVVSSSVEYNAAHHYIDGDGVWTDIDPTVGPGALLTEVTWLDRYVEFNEDLKNIIVIRPSVIQSIVKAFREAVRS